MNYISLKTKEYKKQKKECWHFWFAWFPVTIKEFPDGAKEKVWLQTVLRKGKGILDWTCHNYGNIIWEYEYKKYKK